MEYQKIINLVDNKIADAELQKPQKTHNKIIQKQL